MQTQTNDQQPTIVEYAGEMDEAIALELALAKVEDEDLDRAELSTIIRAIVRKREELQRQKVNYDRIQRQGENLLAWMVKCLYPRAEAITRDVLANTKGKKKSVDDLWGTAGFRMHGGRLVVDDDATVIDAVDHCHLPASIVRTKTIREVDRTALAKWWAEEEARHATAKADAALLAEVTGEIVDVEAPIVPPGCHYENKFEKFYIK